MAHTLQSYIHALAPRIGQLDLHGSIRLLTEIFPGKVTFSSSFSFEDQAITHAIATHQLPVSIFTLDTGRLFAETYSVWNATRQKYQLTIHAFYPQHEPLEAFVAEKGPNAFYESVENRKDCCFIRKVEPLKRALAGNEVWITGLRSEHSLSRQDLPQIEWDEANGIIKFHPLLHWPTEDVKKYIQQHNIPYNPLHDKGFVSIGCAPCTRAIQPGEDFRAGRWWWEDSSKKECGLHIHAPQPETETAKNIS